MTDAFKRGLQLDSGNDVLDAPNSVTILESHGDQVRGALVEPALGQDHD